MMRIHIYLLLIACCLCDLAKINTLLKNNIESVASNVKEEIEKLFVNRCSNKCECAYHTCDVKYDKICDIRWSTDSCPTCGQMVNLEKSILTFGNRFYDVDPNDPYVNEIICGISQIDKLYKKIAETNSIMFWNYFGTYNGVMRSYPANYGCFIYDPRYRPWYVSAASGSKDLIFLIDS